MTKDCPRNTAASVRQRLMNKAKEPEPDEITYPTLLDFPAPTLKAYPRETVVAEKFQTMVMLGIVAGVPHATHRGPRQRRCLRDELASKRSLATKRERMTQVVAIDATRVSGRGLEAFHLH